MDKYMIYLCIVILTISACSKEIDCDINNDGTVQPQEQRICEKQETNIAREELPKEVTTNSTNHSETLTTVKTAFIAIHMESGNNAKTTENPEEYWNSLVELVNLADQYNIKLTLLFNPQWGTYILQDNNRLILLREWEANGHEIGVHHHGPGYGNGWNGYTNQAGYETNEEYLGTIDDMMTIMNQLPASGKIFTGGISTDQDAVYDMPTELMYETNGIEYTDVLSTPIEVAYGDHTVLRVTHSLYAVGKHTISYEQVQDALASAGQDQIVGIVFHVNNYAENPKKVVDLFELFKNNNVEVKSVKEILKDY